MSSNKIPDANLGADTTVPKPSSEPRPEKTPDKGSDAPRKGEPKGVGFGKERNFGENVPPHASKTADLTVKHDDDGWTQAAVRAATDIKKKFGPIDREKAKHVTYVFRSTLLPHRPRGRKPSKAVAIAAPLYDQMMPWEQIYPIAIEGFQNMSFAERSYRTFNLRRAVKAYHKRRRNRVANHRPRKTES